MLILILTNLKLDIHSVRHFKILILGLFLFTGVAIACDGPYKDQTVSRNKLKQLLTQDPQTNFCGAIFDNQNLRQMNLHRANFQAASFKGARLDGSDLSSANLQDANLRGAKLERTYFRWANLTQANLEESYIREANFVEAKLNRASFKRAQIWSSDFSSAELSHVDFSLIFGTELNFNAAKLESSDFRLSQIPSSRFVDAQAIKVNFNETNLQRTNFSRADLSNSQFKDSVLAESDFSESLLHNVNFQQADLNFVIYRPDLSALPNLAMLATASNFETMIFYDVHLGAPALKALQIAYKKTGIRSMERLITKMIKLKQMQTNFDKGGFYTIAGLFSYIFFYLTCDFGLSPGKPLVIFLIMMIVLSIPYYLSLGARSPHSGIIVAWPSRRDPIFILEASYQHFVKIHEHDPMIIRLIKRYRRYMSAFYFSLLSSFTIGWQDFNLANWITQVQTKDYHFIARGWVRSLAGLQAIISAYLIVLWALTYFGRPFEW